MAEVANGDVEEGTWSVDEAMAEVAKPWTGPGSDHPAYALVARGFEQFTYNMVLGLQRSCARDDMVQLLIEAREAAAAALLVPRDGLPEQGGSAPDQQGKILPI